MEITAKHPKEVEQAFMSIAEQAFNSLPASQPANPLTVSAPDTPMTEQVAEQKKCCA
jgi:hypothetical protein